MFKRVQISRQQLQALIPNIAVGEVIGKGASAFLFAGEHQGHKLAIKAGNVAFLHKEAKNYRALGCFDEDQRLFPRCFWYFHDRRKHNDLAVLVMSYVGPCLSKLPSEKINIPVLMQTMLRALYRLHSQGMVHCDVKPGNILQQSRDHYVLVDMGLTHEIDWTREYTSTVVGTQNYKSVAICQKKAPRPVDDLISLVYTLARITNKNLWFYYNSESKILSAKISHQHRLFDDPTHSAFAKHVFSLDRHQPTYCLEELLAYFS